jgi:iron complex transport system ATP-binding protein
MLRGDNLTVGVAGRALVAGLDLALAPGDRIALLGPNGTGKTRVLLTLAGLAAPLSGRVLVDGQPVAGWRFPGTVLDVALLGRFPHHGPWSGPGPTDRERTREALAAMGLAGLADRDHGTLSGGERRRLAIARLLAQAPPLLLLDEPCNHLDPAHVVAVLAALRRRAEAGEAGVVMSLHDATLARRFAREAILLFGDGRWERGPVDAILTPANLERLFGTRYAAYHGADGELLFPAA